MNILNNNALSIIILFSCIFSFNLNAQKPKKIFNYLQENQLSLAVEEYNKISTDKEYDNEDKVLFAYAKCLFQIDTNYQKYNPTQAIKEFNGTYILSDIKESVYKFLGKYSLSPEVINKKIINEIYIEAIKLNTVESYTNALNYYSKEHNDNTVKLLELATYNRVKTNKAISQLKGFITKYPESIYKTEIQNLLERETLNNYKSINNIDSLNQFISQFNSSVYKPEAVDFRDSLVLSTVPDNYESLLAFTKKYPDSKFKTEVDNRLPDILYKEVVKSGYSFELCEKFINSFSRDNRVNLIDSITYFNAVEIDSTLSYRNYIKLFTKGYYVSRANNRIESKILSLDKINKCFNLDLLINYAFCDNILDFELEYINRFIYLKYYFNEFKKELKLPKISDIDISNYLLNHMINHDYGYFSEIGYVKCDENCKINHHEFDYNSKINSLKINEKMKLIYHIISQSNYFPWCHFDIEKLDDLHLIHQVYHLGGGYRESQTICVSQNNRIKSVFECCYSQEHKKIERFILNRFKINVGISDNYCVKRIKKNSYTMILNYNKETHFNNDNTVNITHQGQIFLPFNIIGDKINLKLNELIMK